MTSPRIPSTSPGRVATACGGFRSVLAVPLMREDARSARSPSGARNPGRSRTRRSRCCKTFADQAVIAIENVRLFRELKRAPPSSRVGGRATSARRSRTGRQLDARPGDRAPTIVSRATQLAGMEAGSIYEYDEDREEFYLHTTDHLPDELVEALRATPIRKGEGTLGRMAVTARAGTDPRHHGRWRIRAVCAASHSPGLSVAAGRAAAARRPPAGRPRGEPEDARANSTPR